MKKKEEFGTGLALAELTCPAGSAHSSDRWAKSDSGLVIPPGILHRLWGQRQGWERDGVTVIKSKGSKCFFLHLLLLPKCSKAWRAAESYLLMR